MRLAPRIPFRSEIKVQCDGSWFRAKCEDISLFGVRFRISQDAICRNMDCIRVMLPLPDRESILRGRLYRKEHNLAVVLFNEDEEVISSVVGNFLTHSIREKGICPYCGKLIEGKDGNCPECCMPLDFTKADIVRALKRIRLGDVVLRNIDPPPEGVCEAEENVIANCRKMRRAIDTAKACAITDTPVVIVGEEGSGREFIGRYIHKRSLRKDKAFLCVKCSDTPKELLEVEIFGKAPQKGKLWQAEGGTLMIKDIEELSIKLQRKLAKYVKSRSVRLMVALREEPERMIDMGVLDSSLYEEVKGITIHIPPLRERGKDIILLANYFLKRESQEQGKCIRGFTKEAVRLIENYPWHGNVREMLVVIKRAVILCSGEWIGVQELGIDDVIESVVKDRGNSFNLKKHVEKVERELIEKTYQLTKGNISKMSELLGISRPTVYKLLRKYEI